MYHLFLWSRESRSSSKHVDRYGLHCESNPVHVSAALMKDQIVGAVLQTSSYSVPQILVARYITGIGTGIETSTVPMYQSELCEAHKRGRLVSSEPLFVGVGIVIAYFFDYGMSFASNGPIAWRLPVACQIIFAIVSNLSRLPNWQN